MDYTEIKMDELTGEPIEACSCCGKPHKVNLEDVVLGSGALHSLAEQLEKHGGSKPFLLADKNTWGAAGERVAAILEEKGVPYCKYVFPQEHVAADASPVGQVIMGFDPSCDIVLGIGSGTINDISKILANVCGKPYICVATAPSMDGFASDTSSMVMDGVKVSLPSKCPEAVIADTDILKEAPFKMLQAGLGDIIAKYISICEWRLANIINDEYYCPYVAELVRASVKKCVDVAEGLISREAQAVEAVTEALILSGIAMSFAGVTRPASGMEHYFSHLWDMRSLVFGTPEDLHGVQVGVGTLISLYVYELLVQLTPDRARALAYVEAFDMDAWKGDAREFLGESGEGIIALEEQEGKFDKQKHNKRLEVILFKWEEILSVIKEELPSAAYVEQLLKKIGADTTAEALGIDRATAKRTFIATKDIRDKYIGSRLLWDLGVLEEVAAAVFG